MEKYPGYLGILKWSLAQSDGTSASTAKPLSKEDKEFLEKVFADMVVDQVAVLKGCIKVLKLADDPTKDGAGAATTAAAATADTTAPSVGGGAGGGAGADSVATTTAATTAATAAATTAATATAASTQLAVKSDKPLVPPASTTTEDDTAASSTAVTIEERVKQKEEALDEVLELVENIDLANDLPKVGGLEPIIATVGSTHASLRWRALAVLATLAQNNPECQVKIMKAEGLNTALTSLADPDAKARLKAMLAVSALLRGSEPAQDVFAQRNGWRVIAFNLGPSQQERMRTKAAFFCRHMFTRPENRAAAIAATGVVEQLVALIANDNVMLREHALGALVALAADADGVKAANKAKAQPALEARLKAIAELVGEEREFAEEEQAMAKSLLTTLTAAAS